MSHWEQRLQLLPSQERIHWITGLKGTCARENNGSPMTKSKALKGEYVSLRGKRDFIKVLRWGDKSTLSGWAPYNHMDLPEREAGGSGPEEMWHQKQRSEWFKEGTTSQEMQAASSRIWKRQGNKFFPKASKMKCSPAETLTLGHWDPF